MLQNAVVVICVGTENVVMFDLRRTSADAYDGVVKFEVKVEVVVVVVVILQHWCWHMHDVDCNLTEMQIHRKGIVEVCTWVHLEDKHEDA